MPTETKPFWVQATIEGCPPFFAQLHRLCSRATARQLRQMTRLLQAGQVVCLEDADMWVENTGFTADELTRKAHLETFEVGGFQLDSFRMVDGSGVYYKEDQYCYSMLERIEAGFTVMPGIALDRQNSAVFDQAGHLVDVFVPVLASTQFFIPSPSESLPAREEEYALF